MCAQYESSHSLSPGDDDDLGAVEGDDDLEDDEDLDDDDDLEEDDEFDEEFEDELIDLDDEYDKRNLPHPDVPTRPRRSDY